jgi:hypothetical protein
MNLLNAVGALVAGETSQDHEHKKVSALLGRQRDSLSCWCREREQSVKSEREVRRLCTYRRGLGGGGPAEEQRAGDGEKGSPSSTEVKSGGPLGWKGIIGHDGATLLWNSDLTSGWQKSYRALLL